jgi:chaperonin GroES
VSASIASAANFRPHDDQVLVRVLPEASESAGGIIIPESARKPGAQGGDKFLRQGVVLSIGPGEKREKYGRPIDGTRKPMMLHIGDRIVYDHPSNREISVAGELHVILKEQQHVMAVLT